MKLKEKELLIIRLGLIQLIEEDYVQDTNEEEALLDKVNNEIKRLRNAQLLKLKAN